MSVQHPGEILLDQQSTERFPKDNEELRAFQSRVAEILSIQTSTSLPDILNEVLATKTERDGLKRGFREFRERVADIVGMRLHDGDAIDEALLFQKLTALEKGAADENVQAAAANSAGWGFTAGNYSDNRISEVQKEFLIGEVRRIQDTTGCDYQVAVNAVSQDPKWDNLFRKLVAKLLGSTTGVAPENETPSQARDRRMAEVMAEVVRVQTEGGVSYDAAFALVEEDVRFRDFFKS